MLWASFSWCCGAGAEQTPATASPSEAEVDVQELTPQTSHRPENFTGSRAMAELGCPHLCQNTALLASAFLVLFHAVVLAAPWIKSSSSGHSLLPCVQVGMPWALLAVHSPLQNFLDAERKGRTWSLLIVA